MANRVLGVLAGADAEFAALERWASSAQTVVAADGAADTLLAAGVQPDAIVGDMDSASEGALACGARIVRDSDPDRTDCDKLLDHVASEGADAVTLIGVEGDRLDHVLSTLFSSVRTDVSVRLVLRTGLAWIVKPGRPIEAVTTAGAQVSLLPLGEAAGVTLEGVRWPLREQPLTPSGRWSVSNESVGSLVRASVRSGGALLVVENAPGAEPTW